MESLLSRFKKQDPLRPQDMVEKAKQSDAFGRLQQKFTAHSIDVRAGFGPQDVTVGDVVDMVDVYLTATNADTRGAGAPVARMVDVGIATEQITAYTAEVQKLARATTSLGDLERNNPLYALPVDLGLTTGAGLDELSHSPGGLMLVAQQDTSFRPTGKYTLLLTNRQQLDDGKPLEALFVAAGLPVVSNIQM